MESPIWISTDFCRQGDHHLSHDARHDRLASARIAQEASTASWELFSGPENGDVTMKNGQKWFVGEISGNRNLKLSCLDLSRLTFKLTVP